MAAPAFRIDVAPVEGVPGASTLALGGSVTRDDASSVRERLLAWVRTTAATRLVLELSRIERMDTAGAAVLSEAVRVGLDEGRMVLLCSPSDAVLRIFRLAGFEEVLRCCCADPEETHRRLTA